MKRASISLIAKFANARGNAQLSAQRRGAIIAKAAKKPGKPVSKAATAISRPKASTGLGSLLKERLSDLDDIKKRNSLKVRLC